MVERYDVISAVKSRDGSKSYWTKIGVAFPSRNGGFSVFLDYLPTSRNEEGRIQFLLAEPKPRDEAPQRGGKRSATRSDLTLDDPMDDEIPF